MSNTHMSFKDVISNAPASDTSSIPPEEGEESMNDNECIDKGQQARTVVKAMTRTSIMDCISNSSSIDSSLNDTIPNSAPSKINVSLKDEPRDGSTSDTSSFDPEEEDENEDDYIDHKNESIFSNNSNNNLPVKKTRKESNIHTNNSNHSKSDSNSNSNDKMSLVVSDESAVEVIV